MTPNPPAGKLITPVARDPSGNIYELQITADGFLRVNLENNTVSITHVLLDGSIHTDTVAASPAAGDLIVGITQGGGGVKWQVLAKGSASQILRVNAGATALEWASVPGDFVKLARVTLGADAASIDFSSIPATYRHLKVIGYLRSKQVATNAVITLKMNNDGGNNYDYLRALLHHSAAISTVEGIAAASIQSVQVAGNTAPANAFDPVTIDIPNYIDTTNHKQVIVNGSLTIASSSTNIWAYQGYGRWKSASAINQLTFADSTGANIASGSEITLYGIN